METTQTGLRLNVNLGSLDLADIRGIALDLLNAAGKHFDARYDDTANPAEREYHARRYSAAITAHDLIIAALDRRLETNR